MELIKRLLILLSPLAVRTGLEPATSGVTGRHSNQLNYRTIRFFALRLLGGECFVLFCDAKVRPFFILCKSWRKKMRKKAIFLFLMPYSAVSAVPVPIKK